MGFSKCTCVSISRPTERIRHYDRRSLNFVPFSRASGSPGESVDNVLVFIPFGLLVSVNFKWRDFWRKLLIVLGASIAAETIQYIFAIGATDITDVMFLDCASCYSSPWRSMG